MSRVVYVNGLYKRYADALVHAEDRGFQFADAVYEVIEVRDRQLVDATRHLDRLERSLSEIGMAPPMSRASLKAVVGNVVRRNGVDDGLVYVQVTRGAGPRDFIFPSNPRPTVVVIARRQSREAFAHKAASGIAVVTMPDERWGRCDIKTVMLLPACLAKNAAAATGASEVWFVDEQGLVTEGASSNAWIVTQDGTLVTRQVDTGILPGITRATLSDLARAEGINVVERPFTPAEARRAREAFITSATNTVMPVVTIDGEPVGSGIVGGLTQTLRSHFHQCAEFSRL